MPYLRAKAQDYFEELGGGVSSEVVDEGLDARQIQALTDQVFDCRVHRTLVLLLNTSGQTLRGRFRRIYKAVYPYLNTGVEVWLLLWNIAYLFDKTPSYRPWLSWIGVDLRRLGIEDFVRYLIPVLIGLLLTCLPESSKYSEW